MEPKNLTCLHVILKNMRILPEDRRHLHNVRIRGTLLSSVATLAIAALATYRDLNTPSGFMPFTPTIQFYMPSIALGTLASALIFWLATNPSQDGTVHFYPSIYTLISSVCLGMIVYFAVGVILLFL